jgi:hypothetical protein
MFDVVYTEIRNNNHQEKGTLTFILGRLLRKPRPGAGGGINRGWREKPPAEEDKHHCNCSCDPSQSADQNMQKATNSRVEREGPMHVCRQTVHKLAYCADLRATY